MRTIETPEGPFQLHGTPAELRLAIRSLLPFGAFRYAQPPGPGAENGLVMQCGRRELFAVKQQPADCDSESGIQFFQLNRLLIAHALVGYLRNGFTGLFLPVPYLRDNGPDRIESGIACFSFPAPGEDHADCRDVDRHPDLARLYAGQLGNVFSERIYRFIAKLAECAKEIGIPLQPVIGLEVRPRSELGSIGFSFMAVDAHLVCLQTQVDGDDPVWAVLRIAGVDEVVHLPSVPAAIEEHELAQAKGETVG